VIHIVTLERSPIRPMPDFIKAIRRYSDSWRKIIDNVWLVDTEYDAKFLAKILRSYITDDDSLFVVRAYVDSRDDYGGFLKRDTWQWIRETYDHGRFDGEADHSGSQDHGGLSPAPLSIGEVDRG